MKFSGIPKFTRTPTYSVSLSLDYILVWFEKKQKDLNLQINPDFQRGHVWMNEQQIKFMEYFLSGGASGLDFYFNHPGWMGSFKGEFVLVDGLQRFTAIKNFLENKIPAFGKFLFEFEDAIPSTIDIKIHINNLDSKAKVLKWYLEMNSEGTPHSPEELERVKSLLLKENKNV